MTDQWCLLYSDLYGSTDEGSLVSYPQPFNANSQPLSQPLKASDNARSGAKNGQKRFGTNNAKGSPRQQQAAKAAALQAQQAQQAAQEDLYSEEDDFFSGFDESGLFEVFI